LPVLAHPLTVKEPEPLIASLKQAGLVGMEVHYNNFTPAQRQYLAKLADRYGLVATGGSDYHGIDDANETMIGAAGTPAACLENLTAIAKKRGLNTCGL
jgi:predicted metal-dependent phosphoesterase TrpH